MARIEISLAALEYNLERISSQLSSGARFISILKDNAYGHEASLIAPFIKDFGITCAAVKNEAEASRINGVFKDILILSQPARFAKGSVGVYALNDLDDLKFYKNQTIMLKLDTGMSRSGIKLDQISTAIKAAKAQGCELLGAFTHYSSVAHIAKQSERYLECIEEYLKQAKSLNMLNSRANSFARLNRHLSNSGDFAISTNKRHLSNSGNFAVDINKRHLSNSGDFVISANKRHLSDSGDCAISANKRHLSDSGDFAVDINKRHLSDSGDFAEIDGACFHSAATYPLFAGAGRIDNAARVGLAQFGYGSFDLKPVASLYANRLSSRTLEPGDVVGYDEVFCAPKRMISSNYDLGYADGLAFYDGKKPLKIASAAALGKFSMDSFSLASSDEEVCVFKDARVYADAFNISVYEALVRLGAHLPRVLVD